jgi:uncharacterized repeat protein (TIGR03803 family)
MKAMLRQCVYILALFVVPIDAAEAAWTATALDTFHNSDGCFPSVDPILDPRGNIYGAADGFSANDGTVFRLTPPAAGKTAWREDILAVFTGTNGSNPTSLIRDANGNLFGTTSAGGKFSYGVAFELTPVAGKTAWRETVIANFKGANGSYPMGLTSDAKGNLYGMTNGGGGVSGQGTVFRLAPPTAGMAGWTETLLAVFKGTNGAYPAAANLILDAKGNLYGTTSYGGNTTACPARFVGQNPIPQDVGWCSSWLRRPPARLSGPKRSSPLSTEPTAQIRPQA